VIRCYALGKAQTELLTGFALGLYLLVFIRCGSAEFRPVELMPEDMCSFCRMAISEKRFAAELMTKDGGVVKFDDTACMLHFRKERIRPESVVATFVLDFDSREWLKFQEAYFVESSQFKTPMGGGLAAFKAKARAEGAAVRYQGVQLTCETLLQR
jgi:copper chaperone NosL